MLRTHTCGELGKKANKTAVALAGWVQKRRDHGGVIFIDLRDRYGITQLVCNPENKKAFTIMNGLRREDVVRVNGKVRLRPKDMVNQKRSTGEIEVLVENAEVLNKSETPPIEIEDRIDANEDMRLKYRFLDLRRPKMQKQLAIRHKAIAATREFLNSQNFLEIETPLLIRATPEGARDYIVPSRVHPGKFFSLPQSPQLYKQLLMVSGMDKYYQIARCLRDEDLRQDRQPEFTQIDIEMSFVDEDDVYAVCEAMLQHIFKKAINKNIKLPFKRLSYAEAMEKYSSDKPDLRYGLELTDITAITKKSDFQAIKKAELVKCINPEKDFTRKELDDYIAFCQHMGAKGMAWMKVTPTGLESNIAKFFSPALQKELLKKTGAKKGVLMIVADKPAVVHEVMDKLRRKLADDLKLYDKNTFDFCWITHFPLFEYSEERWAPMHHIFSMPQDVFIGKMEKDPSKVTGKLYDCTLNGVELGGGSIRIHRKDIQEEALKVIGMDYKEAEKRFGFLLNAFKYGAPPHGGIAFGMDRIAALLNGQNDIREVIAFPKNKNAENPMDGCPSAVDDEQLKELHIKVDLPKK